MTRTLSSIPSPDRPPPRTKLESIRKPLSIDRDEDEDEHIQQLLQRAKRLQVELNQVDPIHKTWEELCEIISSCRLAELTRHPTLERIYTLEFNPLVRKRYGSVEAYLRSQLGWKDETKGDDGEGRKGGGQRKKEYWTRDVEVKVRVNDWGYSIPNEVTHYVVWVPLPLFHPDLCIPTSTSSPHSSIATNGINGEEQRELSKTAKEEEEARERIYEKKEISKTWEWVSKNGLSGLTGCPNNDDDDRIETLSNRDVKDEKCSEDDPAREIDAFVRDRWKVGDGFQTAYFANPPNLQSVPGLSHFHVMVRRIERRSEWN